MAKRRKDHRVVIFYQSHASSVSGAGLYVVDCILIVGHVLWRIQPNQALMDCHKMRVVFRNESRRQDVQTRQVSLVLCQRGCIFGS
jgi:hypothetical protein